MVIYLIIAGASFAFTALSSAGERRHIDAMPSLHAPCSVGQSQSVAASMVAA
jgi:hypothetical protein